MKRISYYLTIALVLALTLGGCGNAGERQVISVEEEAIPESGEAEEETAAETSGETEEAAAEEAQPAEEAAQAEEAADAETAENAPAPSSAEESGAEGGEFVAAPDVPPEGVSADEGDHSEWTAVDVNKLELPSFDSDSTTGDSGPLRGSGENENSIQIVFMGDSIFDQHRDGTGVPFVSCSYFPEDVEVEIYNLAIGGTRATIERYEQWLAPEEITESSFITMANAVCGLCGTDAFSMYHACEVFNTCDFSKTDIFVVEYGMNDFLSKAPRNDPTYKSAYDGALLYGVSLLQKTYPDAEIVLCLPGYAVFFGEGGRYIGDANMLDNGYGPLNYYSKTGTMVGEELGVYVFNAYDKLGIQMVNYDEYLEDGIHYNENGRRHYAKWLANSLLRAAGYDLEYYVDLDTINVNDLQLKQEN